MTDTQEPALTPGELAYMEMAFRDADRKEARRARERQRAARSQAPRRLVIPVPAVPEMEIGEVPATALYRLYDAADDLLYVGIADNLKVRFDQHRDDKPWWKDVTRKTVTWYGSRIKAMRAEGIAIKQEHPLYNVAGRPVQTASSA